MPMVYTANDVPAQARFAGSVWVRADDAAAVDLPQPWYQGPTDMVNGEQAVCFVHPMRDRALARSLSGDPMTPEEADYIASRNM